MRRGPSPDEIVSIADCLGLIYEPKTGRYIRPDKTGVFYYKPTGDYEFWWLGHRLGRMASHVYCREAVKIFWRKILKENRITTVEDEIFQSIERAPERPIT